MMNKEKTQPVYKIKWLLLLPVATLILLSFNIKRAVATNADFAANSEIVEPESESIIEADTLVNKNPEETQEPLIIIDGMESDSKKLSELGSENIHSFSILKDKTAIELYGERAKNGVIIIETKRDENGNKNDSLKNLLKKGSLKDMVVAIGKKGDSDIHVKGKEYADSLFKKPSKNTLIIIDGKEADADTFEKLDPAMVQSYSILKDKAATGLYGEKGKNGVLIVETKDKTGSDAPQFFIRVPTSDDGHSKDTVTIIDGKEVDASTFKNLDPDKAATALYGEKGKNGVFIVTRKGNIDIYKTESDTTQFFIRGISSGDDLKKTPKLIIIDGKETDIDSLNNLDRENIHSFSILKDDDAIKRYGERGKNGVIIIETKGNIVIDKTGSDAPQFFIRGITTVGNSKEPLILIDGKEADAGTLKNLDRENIHSFRILKDETAKALYGAKGKNGVIIIETKGNENKSDSLRNPSVKNSAKDIIIIDGKEADMDAALQKIAELKTTMKKIAAQRIDSITKQYQAKIHSYTVFRNDTLIRQYVKTKENFSEKDPPLVLVDEKGDTIFETHFEDALIIIDGKEADIDSFKNLDQAKIHSYSILKDDAAIKQYGEKGKNGVIVIETKKTE
jgi:TonB-dependent SusC/RagA subfamily outer membrane receptor